MQVLVHMDVCAYEDLRQTLGIFLDYFPPYTLREALFKMQCGQLACSGDSPSPPSEF